MNSINDLFGSLSELKQLEDRDIINHETARFAMNTTKERILKEFPPKQTSDGNWIVSIRFAPGPEGRKVIRKGSKEKIEEAIIEFVGINIKPKEKKKRNRYQYKYVFDNWIQAQQYQNKNTELRNKREYRRFFEKLEDGVQMSNLDIRLITSTQIEQLMTTAINKYSLSTRKAYEDYRMFFKAVYRQAIADKLIKPDSDPCLFVIERRFLQFGKSEIDKTDDERIIAPETIAILDMAVQKDHEVKEDYMPPFAYELAALTGMRVGELAGLMWKNIDLVNGVIYIVQSQKYNEKTKEYYISDTKNRKKRIIPITDDIRDVLERIQAIQKKYGKTEDYVFSTKKGFSSNRQISDYLQNKKQQYKIQQPISVHAQRRTLNSTMAAQGVPVTVRATLLGHIPRTNQSHYTYDAIAIDKKREIIANAGKR